MSTPATWPVFTAKLKSREEVAERTMAFRFERADGWTFKAGQFIDMTLLAPRRRTRKAIRELFNRQCSARRDADGGDPHA